MKIIVGKYAGFCNGARTAVEKTNEALEGEHPYSIGEIIHNEEVINYLKQRGLIVKDSIDDIPNNSKLIIRAHGEGMELYQETKKRGINLIDLTCEKVRLVHDRILDNKDKFVIIIGKKAHPETIAHQSYSDTNCVIENINEIKDAYQLYLNSGKKEVAIVAQTTFNIEMFDRIVNEIKMVFKDTIIEVNKTICPATKIRQKEAKEIASKVNKMIVIGGKDSSNTKELAVVAKSYCNDTYLIQTKKDLIPNMFDESDIVGVTAGASTPKELIDDVVNYLGSIYKKDK